MNDDMTYVLDSMETLIANTRDDQLALPTPCTKWTVRDLINHFVAGGHMFAMLYRGETPSMDGPPPDLVGDDPAAAAHAARADFDAAIAAPGAMEQMVAFPFGTLPAPVGMQLAMCDVLIHCWDLATATGQTFEPPSELVATAAGYARNMITPEARDGDTFGPEVTPPPGASPLTRLAAFAGRG